jgi:hypothetical protein
VGLTNTAPSPGAFLRCSSAMVYPWLTTPSPSKQPPWTPPP